MEKTKWDFGGTATKFNIRCADGKILDPHSCDSNIGKKVPLVWQHCHDDPEMVLGHAILTKKKDGSGMYCKCKLNMNNPKAVAAKESLKNGDIDSLSIFANDLVREGNLVKHANIREVSLVLAGANPGASIDYVAHGIDEYGEEYLEHGVDDSDEAIITSGENPDFYNEEEDSSNMENTQESVTMSKKELDSMLEHAATKAVEKAKAADNRTVQDVYDTMNDEQKQLVEVMVGKAVEDTKNEMAGKKNTVKHDDMDKSEVETDEEDTETNDEEDVPEDMQDDNTEVDNEENENEEEDNMQHNAFENTVNEETISHDALRGEVMDMFNDMGSFKKALHSQDFLEHAAATGVTNISNLFPEPKAVDGSPFILEKDAEWVAYMMSNISKQPFGRVKSNVFDISQEQARAKGYIKGAVKSNSQFAALKRVTNPTIVYAKANLDKQDILEITDFSIVSLLKHGLDVVLKNEICQQILVSDLREASSADKIDNNCVRPICSDVETYTIKAVVTIADNATSKAKVDEIRNKVLHARADYRGSGSTDFYATPSLITDMMLAQDGIGHDLYETEDKLANALRCKKLIEVPQMEGATFTEGEGSTAKTYKVLGIVVNIKDYKIGAVKGGEVSSYEDFDIDVNQMKYLTETFMSGCLVRPKSAIVIVQEVTTSAVG